MFTHTTLLLHPIMQGYEVTIACRDDSRAANAVQRIKCVHYAQHFK